MVPDPKDSLPSCLCWHLIRLTFLHFIKTSLNILEFFCVRKAPGLNFQIHHIFYHCLQNNWRINVNDWISSYNGQSTKAKMFTLTRKRHGKYIAPIQFLVKSLNHISCLSNYVFQVHLSCREFTMTTSRGWNFHVHLA